MFKILRMICAVIAAACAVACVVVAVIWGSIPFWGCLAGGVFFFAPDFLYLTGAENALAKLNKLADRKDEKNRINRVANCLQKNYDKSVLASVKHIRAIERIEGIVGLSELDPALRETAAARLADKEASLKELSERLGITKSCLNHRLRKLVKLAEDLDGEE